MPITAILGYGSARIVKDSHGNDIAIVKITISGEKYKVCEPLLEKLKKEIKENGLYAA